MNGLSLRISTARSSDPVKRNLEFKQETINIQFSKEFKNEDVVKFIQAFSGAQTVEEQLKLIKTVTLNEFSQEEFLQLFCEVYVGSPAKHAVRNNLSKLIDKTNSERSAEFLASAIEAMLSVEYPEPGQQNELIYSLGGVMENFRTGKEALKRVLPLVLGKLAASLDVYLEILRKESNSPAFKNDICQYIHTVLRVLIAVAQHCDSEFKWCEFSSIEQKCWKIIDETDIPIDTKTNAALLIVANAKGKGEISKLLTASDDQTKTLCICFGILCTIHDDANTLSCVTQKMDDLISANIMEPCLILCTCRVMMQFSKSLKLQPSQDALNLCLTYAINNLDHYMDSVRHMSRDILKNLIGIGDTVDRLFSTLDDPMYSKTNKGTMLTCMCQVKGSALLFEKIPNICQQLLDWLEDNSAHNTNSTLSSCYENLFNLTVTEQTPEIWFNNFILPLIDHLRLVQDQSEIRRTVESLIMKAVKRVPRIIFHIQKQHVPISIMLNCLGTAKKCGTFDGITSTQEKWKEIVNFEDIQSAMVSSTDETRMAALALIAESHKVTEFFSKEEFDAVLYFMKYNINCQNAALRQQFLGHVRNMFIRLQSNLLHFRRQPQDPAISHYTSFLYDLALFCFNNFFPTANFNRRTLSLKLLIHIIDILDANPHFCVNIWTTDHYRIMLNCLDDSYEINKMDALTILRKCPKHLLQNDKVSLDAVKVLANSPKPADSLTAAYYLEYLLFISPDTLDVLGAGDDLKLNALRWVMKEVDIGISDARESIVQAAKNSPLYGFMFCVRHILSKLEWAALPVEEWRSYVDALIEQCRHLTEVVGPVVNNSSPEGHLPNDFGTTEAEDITSQMVLVCAWRTVKEVSLILGDISFTKLVSVERLLGIGSHFTTLLSETKHRGAFEQAYVGFSRLCVRFWSAEEEELHTLPMRWLKALMRIISGDVAVHEPTLDMSVDKLCATRRSAGVPFLIQALITTELQIGSCKGLKFCMETLLDLCKSGSTESRTHALNILRALFRCTDLGEAIAEYVAEGFIAAINGYDGDTWAERNSSTLLFSALMVRVFGVQRSRDSEKLNIRNKMTGRIFFLRYPKLFDFFYAELHIAAQTTLEGQRCRKLHSILLLLNRLYPSSLEGVESNLLLTRFIPLVSTCGGSPELKTRYLAARIIPIFISPDDVIPRIYKTLQLLEDTEDILLNSLHGAFLQLQYLVKCLPREQESHALKHVLKQIIVLDLPKIPIIWSSFYDVIFEVFVKMSAIDFEFNLTHLLLETELEDIGWNILNKKLVLMKFLRILQTPTRSMIDVFIKTLDVSSLDYETQEAALNILLLIVNFDEIVDDADELEITEIEIQLVRRFLDENPKNVQLFRNYILENRELFVQLHPLLKVNYYYLCSVKAFTLVSYSERMATSFVNALGGDYLVLVELAESKTGHLRDVIYGCLRRYFSTTKVKIVDLQGVVNASLPGNSEKLRLIAVEMISLIREPIITSGRKNMTLFYTFFWCLFTLLRDDCPQVRTRAAANAIKIYNNYFNSNHDDHTLASIARELLFKMLHDYLFVTFNGKKDRIALVYVEIMMLDKIHLEQQGNVENDASRCFDKNNEGNIYAENFIIKLECFKRMQEVYDLLGEENADLKSTIESIKEDLVIEPNYFNIV